MVQLLLDYRADVHAGTAAEQRTPLFGAFAENMCQTLVKANAVVDARDKSKRTPLFIAAQAGQVGAMRYTPLLSS